jgi:hypothetical protein
MQQEQKRRNGSGQKLKQKTLNPSLPVPKQHPRETTCRPREDSVEYGFSSSQKPTIG